MKHLKTYEEVNTDTDTDTDKGIYEKDGNTVVNIYKLAGEMMDKINTKNKKILKKAENEFKKIIKNLFVNAVINFYDSGDDQEITGICENIDFNNDPYNDKPDDVFQIDALEIYMEGLKDSIYFTGEEITIINENTKLFRSRIKYNL